MITTTMKQVKKQEKRIAKELKGKRIPLSGAGWEKWDVKSDKFIVDCKQTAGKTISLSRKNFEKISRDAIVQGKIPAFHLLFEGSSFPEWVIIPYNFFKNLIEEKNEI
jgi:hypothetical protein